MKLFYRLYTVAIKAILFVPNCLYLAYVSFFIIVVLQFLYGLFNTAKYFESYHNLLYIHVKNHNMKLFYMIYTEQKQLILRDCSIRVSRSFTALVATLEKRFSHNCYSIKTGLCNTKVYGISIMLLIFSILV